jgi:gamma-glutamyltranspeptidase / glutathione hydrolase
MSFFMMKKICFVWVFLAALCCSTQAQITPFPYDIQKEALGDSAMVVSAHPLATKVGLDILRKGGNAIDAAVAVQFALAVVYPQAGNIGGGGFLVLKHKNGTVATLDYREEAPAAAFEKMYQDSTGKVLSEKSQYDVLAAGVPGSVDGMWEAHQKYGKLKWWELVEPAISLAELGFQITDQEAQNLNEERFNFIKNCSITPEFVKFAPWTAGDWLIQKDLAKTFRFVASNGRAGFYEGPVATMIETEMKKRGGLITTDDLKNFHSVWRTPLEFDHKGLHVITMPPPSSGGIILRQLLAMTGDKSLKTKGFHSAEAVHLMVEAERRAYADRAEHMGDPDFYKVPLKMLTDTTYIRNRFADFNATAATPSKNITAGQIKVSEETTHYSIVDQEGNAVSVTTTLNDSYGSRTVVTGAGFILNNEMDDFSAKPGVPNIYGAIGGTANAIRGNKRPLSSMTPTIVTKGGKVWMIVGTPGGTTIPTSVFQVITNVVEFEMTLKEAIQSGRFHHQWVPDRIAVEDAALPEATVQQLQKMGHNIFPREPIGRVEGIMRQADGRWQGVADRRGDDHAAGY